MCCFFTNICCQSFCNNRQNFASSAFFANGANNASAFGLDNNFANGYCTNNSNGFNPANAYNATNGFATGYNNYANNWSSGCRMRHVYFGFGRCCNRGFCNNFAIDRPVSASFVHTPDYHHIAEIGFL